MAILFPPNRIHPGTNKEAIRMDRVYRSNHTQLYLVIDTISVWLRLLDFPKRFLCRLILLCDLTHHVRTSVDHSIQK